MAPCGRAGDAGPVAPVDDGVRQDEEQVADAAPARSPRSAGTIFSIRPATFGPTPSSEVTGANSGSRREGRIGVSLGCEHGMRKADRAALSTLYARFNARTWHGMTGTTRSSDGLDPRRRKLLFRSWHRGMREMDLILGGFADAEIDDLDRRPNSTNMRGCSSIQDADLLSWVTGEQPVPRDPTRRPC